jgi:hypothetical protein
MWENRNRRKPLMGETKCTGKCGYTNRKEELERHLVWSEQTPPVGSHVTSSCVEGRQVLGTAEQLPMSVSYLSAVTCASRTVLQVPSVTAQTDTVTATAIAQCNSVLQFCQCPPAVPVLSCLYQPRTYSNPRYFCRGSAVI